MEPSATSFATARRVLFLTVFGLSAAGCGDEATEPTRSSNAGNTAASSPSNPIATAQSSAALSALPGGLGCGWSIASDANLANLFFPDKAARYWVAYVPLTPAMQVRVRGQYPEARYFSFNAYGPTVAPTDALADFELSPVAGGANPFTKQGAKPGDTYQMVFKFGDIPTSRAPNTLYSGSLPLMNFSVPNGFLGVMFYRTYVASGEGLRGNVPLPTLTLETSAGEPIATLPTCEEPPLPTLGGLLPSTGVNQLLNESDYPDQLPLPLSNAANPPAVEVFRNTQTSVADFLQAQLGIPGTAPKLPSTGSGGFASNIHNDYTTTLLSRRHGNLVLFRGRAPTFRGQTAVAFGEEQVRYWSICQNEFYTQRFTDCVLDSEAALDSDGFYTVAISDAADRPPEATASNGISWLPWGPYPDGLILYRQMLANPAFSQAIRRVGINDSAPQVMGDYFPEVTYCRPEVFSGAGTLTPRQRFEACKADQRGRM